MCVFCVVLECWWNKPSRQAPPTHQRRTEEWILREWNCMERNCPHMRGVHPRLYCDWWYGGICLWRLRIFAYWLALLSSITHRLHLLVSEAMRSFSWYNNNASMLHLHYFTPQPLGCKHSKCSSLGFSVLVGYQYIYICLWVLHRHTATLYGCVACWKCQIRWFALWQTLVTSTTERGRTAPQTRVYCWSVNVHIHRPPFNS